MTTFSQTTDPKNTPETPGTDDTNTSQQQKQPTNEPNSDQRTSAFLIVGDRAYRDENSVVTKITNADNHISTLESERKNDRERITSLESELDNQKNINAALEAKLSNNSGNGSQTDTLSKEELVKEAANLANQMNANAASEAQRNNNIKTAMDQAKEIFGDNYLTKVNEIAQQNGMTIEAVDALAKESPKGFAKIFFPADKQQSSSTTPSQGSINSEGVVNKPTDRKPFNAMKQSAKELADEVERRLASLSE